jgi:threonine dehydrogenase-like Zn-dependent dehydrogenase
MVFILEGAQVWGYDIIDANSTRTKLLEQMGGHYIDGKKTKPQEINTFTKRIDVILEAVGNTRLDFDLFSALSENGIYVLTGVAQRDKTVTVDGGKIMERLVMKNQVIVGSVNANIVHWEKAIKDLLAANKRWHNIPNAFITHRFSPHDFKIPFFTRPENEIKTVIRWSND